MQKNISEAALNLKKKIVSTLKAPIFNPQLPPESDCKDLLEEIKVNSQIISQIKYIDQEIEQLQLNIAELRNQYEFVGELGEGDDSRYKDMDWEEETKEVQFLKQRDIKSRLLRHLQNVEKATKSIGYQQILGLNEKRVAEHSRKHFSQHFKSTKLYD